MLSQSRTCNPSSVRIASQTQARKVTSCGTALPCCSKCRSSPRWLLSGGAAGATQRLPLPLLLGWLLQLMLFACFWLQRESAPFCQDAIGWSLAVAHAPHNSHKTSPAAPTKGWLPVLLALIGLRSIPLTACTPSVRHTFSITGPFNVGVVAASLNAAPTPSRAPSAASDASCSGSTSGSDKCAISAPCKSFRK